MEEAAAELWIPRRRAKHKLAMDFGLYICAHCQYLHWGNWKWGSNG
jgi:hypothetical protein